ncbi:hypothetical protein EUX98_g374 [Antrodiella citrinella]|uniref:Transcription initiation factor TFIID subunit 8 n=1 Tax=Antrodiella citrinella TaxID=2447956 RepID=A0A4S4N738_9APHY|nr:hypothetical protein EUX98_g374 [Antrodiella citrinella]
MATDVSYYSTQQAAYGSFQAAVYPTAATYPGQSQFQAQYPGQGSYSMYGNNPPGSPVETPSAPEAPGPSVSPEIASSAMQKLILSELQDAGFDAASAMAMDRFEHETIAFIEKLFTFAHDYANHANRTGPVAVDLILASKRYGVDPREMYRTARCTEPAFTDNSELGTTVLDLPPPRTPSPELLPSDDEDSLPVVPATLRVLPHNFYLPALPPKHTYLHTPISPPKKAALPSLEKKLKNASVVQESLKNLLLATEDNNSSEDKVLFDAAVNWESTVHPRKRWRLDQ